MKAKTVTAFRSNAWQPMLQSIKWTHILGWGVVLILVLITLFPFWWLIRTALTSQTAILRNTQSLLPVDPTLDNFRRVLGLVDTATAHAEGGAASLNLLLIVRNTLIVSLLTTFGQVSFSAMAAYAFARLHFPFRDKLFFLYILGLMIPGIVLLIPNFVLIKNLGWIGTFQGIVAPTFLMSPFAVFFLRQFFMTLSTDLEEAARLDGASRFGILWRIGIPLSLTPIITLSILTFIGAWNDFLWPLLVGQDESVRVLTVALSIFREQTPGVLPDWAGLMAATALGILPTLVLFFFLGRKVVDSIQFSGFR